MILTAFFKIRSGSTACMRVDFKKGGVSSLLLSPMSSGTISWRLNRCFLGWVEFSNIGDVCIPRSSYASLLRNSGAYGDSIVVGGNRGTKETSWDFGRVLAIVLGAKHTDTSITDKVAADDSTRDRHVLCESASRQISYEQLLSMYGVAATGHPKSSVL